MDIKSLLSSTEKRKISASIDAAVVVKAEEIQQKNGVKFSSVVNMLMKLGLDKLGELEGEQQ